MSGAPSFLLLRTAPHLQKLLSQYQLSFLMSCLYNTIGIYIFFIHKQTTLSNMKCRNSLNILFLILLVSSCSSQRIITDSRIQLEPSVTAR